MENKEKEFSLEEVARHNTVDSAWIILRDNVLDITDFLQQHPGGAEVLLRNAGTDATGVFVVSGHSQDAIEISKGYIVGKLKKPCSAT